MKKTMMLLILGLIWGNLISQSLANPDKLEVQLKVYEESEKALQRFIKKQARIRKKLDKHVEVEDLEKVEFLRSIYQKQIDEVNEKEQYIKTLAGVDNSEVLLGLWQNMSRRYVYLIRSHEIITPLLGSHKGFRTTAEYLSNKYSDEIAPLQSKIAKAYWKLLQKQGKIYSKYADEEEKNNKKNNTTAAKVKKTRKSRKGTVLSDVKVLLVK